MTEPAPILPYATPGDTGVPSFYPPVEAMLDARCRPKAIRVHFRKSAHAVTYFVNAMQRRFSIEQLGHLCEVCGEVCDGYATLTWEVEMPRKKMELSLMDSSPKADFDTHHALCRPCFARWKLRMKWVKSLRLLACLAMAAGLIWMFIGRKWPSGGIVWTSLVPCGLLIAGLAVLVTGNGLSRLVAPWSIRHRLPRGLTANWLSELKSRNTGATA